MGHKPDPRRHYPPTPAPATPPAPPPVVTVEKSHCPKCGSAERSEYCNRREHEYTGLRPDGTIYHLVVWRRTRCTACGQVRDDKTYE
jgi:predicted RNA-binding Zn-ribbon protein involved in translation (DUF1610 family)